MSIVKHEDKMIQLQQQLQENQLDLQSYLADMDSWENDMREKEDKLKSKPAPESMKLPPVRNSLERKKVKKKKKKESDKRGKRISGYDYRSWDTFDIDKALEDVDGKQESSESEETDEEWEIERNIQLADKEKEQGNICFRNGDYAQAIDRYSRGITLDPTNPLLPANRAMALLKQDKYGAAEVDSSSAIALDPLYIKGYLRRASARVGLAKLTEALADYRRVLHLDPTHKVATQEVEQLEKVLNRTIEDQPKIKAFVKSGDEGVVLPVHKPSGTRSQKPLLRISIEEIGIEKDTSQVKAIDKVKASQSEMKRKVCETDDKMFSKFTAEPREDEKAGVNNLYLTSDRVNSERVTSDSVTSSLLNREIPKTSFQFQSDYKVLKVNRAAFCEYFKRIPANQLPSLFGEMLDSDILGYILVTFRDYFLTSGQSFIDHLTALTRVKRFDMTAMFLTSQEKAIVTELLQEVKKTDPLANVEQLAKKFGVNLC